MNFAKLKEIYLVEYNDFISKREECSEIEIVNQKRFELVAYIKRILNDNDENNILSGENNYGKVEYFEIISRTKSEKSISEKLLRTDFSLRLLSQKKEKDFLESFMNDLDDLIGIRVLCWVKKDVENVYKILKSTNESLDSKRIIFHNLDLQPETMKNSFKIYRIKGSFDTYPFELQIKSRLEDAWAEIEHTNFYKKPIFTRERKVFQNILNKNYELLEKIDETLEYIREGSSNLTEIANLKEYEEVRNNLDEKIKLKIGHAMNLKKFEKYLMENSSTLKIVPELDVSIQSTMLSNTCKNYDKARSICWDLILLEALFLTQKKGETLIKFTESILEPEIQRNNYLEKVCYKSLCGYLQKFWFCAVVLKQEKKEIEINQGTKFEVENKYSFDFNVLISLFEQMKKRFSLLEIDIDALEKAEQEAEDFFVNCIIYKESKSLLDTNILGEKIKLNEDLKKLLNDDNFMIKIEKLFSSQDNSFEELIIRTFGLE